MRLHARTFRPSLDAACEARETPVPDPSRQANARVHSEIDGIADGAGFRRFA